MAHADVLGTWRFCACRPGFGRGEYVFTRGNNPIAVPLCPFNFAVARSTFGFDDYVSRDCVNQVLDETLLFGTTIAWVATPGTPASEPGASSKVFADIAIVDAGGVICRFPAVSQSASRTVLEATCLLLDSPEDAPTSGPLLP